jgi:hypothetical protein
VFLERGLFGEWGDVGDGMEGEFFAYLVAILRITQ